MNNETIKGIQNISLRLRFFLLFLAAALCLTVLFRDLDNDIWFLLSHGRHVLEEEIPTIEPFTIHQDFSFVMQQWLSATIFYWIYSILGEFGLKVLVYVSYVLSTLIFYRLCLIVSGNQFVQSILTTYIYVALVSLFMTSRPFIFTNIILLLEVYVLESYFLDRNRKILLALPFLSLVLINVQAAIWPMLLVVMLPYLIDSFAFKFGPLVGRGIEKGPLVISVLLIILAGFLNPYGLDAMLYLVNSYGVAEINAMVIEMAPATVSSILVLLIMTVTIGLTFIYGFSKNPNKSLRYTLLALGTTYLSLSTIRGFLFFISCALFPLVVFMDLDRIPQFDKTKPERTLVIRKILLVAIAIMLPLTFYSLTRSNNHGQSDRVLFEQLLNQVVADRENKEVILYTGYNDGGLAEFHRIPTYMDPRAEVFLKKNNLQDDVFAEYYQLQNGQIFYKTVLDKYGFTHLLVGKGDILYEYLLHDDEYQLGDENDQYRLFRAAK